MTLEKSERASDVVLKLSELLDYVLYKCTSDFVSLNQEINQLKNYIELEKLRYGDRLDVDFNHNNIPKNGSIPPMLFMTLLENSFKHGVSKTMDHSWINIGLQVDGKITLFTIENSKHDVADIAPKKSGGIGLENLQNRLKLIYRDNYDMKIKDTPSSFAINLKLTNSTKSCKTRCLIVDDEPLALKVIESHISKVPSLELICSCKNAMEAFDVLLKKKVDLVFLDVEMPEISGVDLLKSLNNGPAVIFITAYRDFALDAFELDAIDYLLKPVSFERFFKAVSKYFQWKGHEGVDVKSSETSSQYDDSFIYVRSDRKVVKILLKDNLFFESIKDYVKIHLEKDLIITKEKLSNLEDKLPRNSLSGRTDHFW